MASAFVKLVHNSTQQEITLDQLKELFFYYKEITGKTGEQLGWEYEEAAFPYDLKEKEDANGKWFYLKGHTDRYNYILLGIGTEEVENEEEETHTQHFIQITLPNDATHGDKGKANEFCKFLGKKLAAELHLFNGRIMYYYKR